VVIIELVAVAVPGMNCIINTVAATNALIVFLLFVRDGTDLIETVEFLMILSFRQIVGTLQLPQIALGLYFLRASLYTPFLLTLVLYLKRMSTENSLGVTRNDSPGFRVKERTV
jgi:hypothetical protein